MDRGDALFRAGTYCPPNGSGCVTPEYAGPLGLSLPGDYKTGFPLVIQAPNVGTLWAWEYVQQGRPPLTGYVDGRWVHDGSDATGSMDIFVY